VCAGLLAAYAWPTGALERALTAPPLAYLLLLGSTLCSMGIGDSLYFLAAARIGVSRALPIAAAFPLLTTVGAVLFLSEPPTAALIVGTSLVVGAVALIAGDRIRDGKRPDALGLLWAGLAACMWAGSGLFLGPALQLVDPLAGNMIRFPIAAVLFVGYLAVMRPAERINARMVWLSVLSAVGTLASALMFLSGIDSAGVARGVALNATSPVFSAILAALLLRERVSRRVAVGIVASVVGTILLVV
jgi:drug/metabolite transporter (DMT)-like permease